MKQVNLTCIGCPMGCALTVDVEGKEVRSVSGNNCGVGEKYARKELTNPTRILTTTVRVSGGDLPVVSVKTAGDVPKARLSDCVRALKNVEISAPVSMGQVVVKDLAGTGVSVVATREIRTA